MRVRHALSGGGAAEAERRLRSRTGPIAWRSWRDAPEPGDILILAPHEYSAAHRLEICRAADWSWVHLTSAGTDFVDLAGWPSPTLLTRSWRCYAAPLAEYAVHAMLTHEWRRGAPWSLPDHRPTAGMSQAPVPELEPVARAGLSGARVGVAGWGEAGRRVAVAAQALGAEVVVLRRAVVAHEEQGVRMTTDPLEVVNTDHLVVALPVTEQTYRLFDDRVLSAARPGLHLVNVSRPQVLDQEALVKRCAVGAMAATLDVTEPEPLTVGHPLRTLPSVRLSPHVAWRSRASGYGYIDDFAALVTDIAERGSPTRAAWVAGDPRAARTVLAEMGEESR